MDSINIAILFSTAINFSLAIFVLSKGRKKKANIAFSWFAFSVVAWNLFMLLYRIASDASLAAVWCRLLYVSPVLIVVSLVYFAYIFPKLDDNHFFAKIAALLFCGGTVMIILILFTDNIIDEVILLENSENEILFGPWYLFLYTSYISGHFVWFYFVVLNKFRKASGATRPQLFYIFLGIFICSFLGMFSNLLLPSFGNFSLNWMGQVTSLIMVGVTSYAITIYRLMDIRLALRNYSVYLLSIISLVIIALLTKYLISLFSFKTSFFFDLLLLLSAISFYPSFRSHYYRFATKYFFSSLYDEREVIIGLTEKLKSSIDIENVYRHIYESISDNFHAKTITILTYDGERKKYSVRFDVGHAGAGNYREFVENKDFADRMIKDEVLLIEDFRGASYVKYKETVDMLRSYRIEALVPLVIKRGLVGIIALGPKVSGDMYNEEDVRTLKIISTQMAFAIQNALLFEETKDFGQALKKRIREASDELIAANEKLRRLDETKSEFISVASHQLRTPLTVIKGYISMLMEKSFGEVSPEQMGVLSKIFQSSERLIQLVENLLNISRIESGRLRFDFQKGDLAALVESVAAKLKYVARTKGLEISFAASKNLPSVFFDEEKIRQAVMNLIDNAIRYSKKGLIEVSVRKSGNGLAVSVKDSGMGIDKEDMSGLFDKFARGTDTALVHTEGIGLGLYVARKLIELHGGKIWAESRGKDKGTVFCFTLPIREKAPVPDEKAIKAIAAAAVGA